MVSCFGTIKTRKHQRDKFVSAHAAMKLSLNQQGVMKDIKTYSTLILVYFFTTNLAMGQAQWDIVHYDGIPELDKHLVFEDNFSEKAQKTWQSNDRQKTKITHNKGTIYLASANNNRGVIWQDLKLSRDADFEIEMTIRFVRGKREAFSYMFWEAANEKRIGFGISRQSMYKGVIYKDYRYTNFIRPRKYEFIETSDFNQVTVRKIGRKLYCFVNGALVETRNYHPAFGQFFGITVAPKSTIEVDNFSVRELREAPMSMDNNEPIHEKSMEDEDY